MRSGPPVSRRRSEWPEPWTRLKWSPGDIARLDRLMTSALTDRDRAFITEMQRLAEATLQQVAWMRTLARRYQVDPPLADQGPGKTRHIVLPDDV